MPRTAHLWAGAFLRLHSQCFFAHSRVLKLLLKEPVKVQEVRSWPWERRGQWPWPDPQCPEEISLSPWCIPVSLCANALCWMTGVTPALSGLCALPDHIPGRAVQCQAVACAGLHGEALQGGGDGSIAAQLSIQRKREVTRIRRTIFTRCG